MSGCRLGNRVEQAAQPEMVSGLYGTEAKTLEVCVTYLNQAEACAPANINLVPPEFAAVFSNPVGLVIDEDTGKGQFVNPFGNNGPSLITELILPARTVSFTGGATMEIMGTGNWLPTAVNDCETGLEVTEAGSLNDVDKGTVMFGSELSGRLDLSLTVEKVFQKTSDNKFYCGTATLDFLEACFKNAADCQGTGAPQNTQRQAEVASLYTPYIESSLITPDQISEILIRKYTITYK